MQNHSVALMFLRNPFFLGLVFIVMMMLALLSVFIVDDDSEGGGQLDRDTISSVYDMCEEISVEDYEELTKTFHEQLKGKGVLEDTADYILSVASRYNVDPVLLVSIILYETNNGTSTGVRENNNPSRLTDNTGKLLEFKSLQEGIDYFAKHLFDNYITKGKQSVEDIGKEYAPIGSENDPNNLNANWVSSVKDNIQDFGGLILDCKSVEFGTGEFAYPVADPIITSNFGYRTDPITGAQTEFHKGIDFRCTYGDYIYSAEEGRVMNIVTGCVAGDMDCGGGYGNYVVLEHGNNYTLYAHMERVLVSYNETVTRSQPIGMCGTTGSSTGTHLHFEVQLSYFNERVDPYPFFEQEEDSDV